MAETYSLVETLLHILRLEDENGSRIWCVNGGWMDWWLDEYIFGY